MKNKILIIIIMTFVIMSTSSASELSADSYWKEIKTTFSYMKDGAIKQFESKNNLYTLAVAVPTMWYVFEEDKRITYHEMSKKVSKPSQLISDLAPVVSFPLIQAVFLTYGLKNNERHEVEFATQTMATMYLALLESAALSVVDVHERPKKEELSKWETQFRGKSSFPSGHVIPYAALAIKTYQFYGPLMAAIPTSLYVATSYQRVRDGKHYVSDVIGSFFLTMFAAEGVRNASSYKKNHPLFNAIFDKKLNISYSYYKGTIGPRISFEW